MTSKMHVGVVGCGNWGTTLAHLLSQSCENVLLWGRDSELIKTIQKTRKNLNYTGELQLSTHIQPTDSLSHISSCTLIFIVVPSHSFRSIAYELGNYVRGNQILVSATKGIEQKTYKFMSEILREETCVRKIGAFSGPNIANEIIAKQPAASVIASKYEEVIEIVWQALSSEYFKVYGSHDVQGVETAGALKNIIAIACGLAEGLNLENNTKSFILTRGLREILKFGCFLGASSETFLGLAGVGDLVTTCFSQHSRNHRFGKLLAQGKNFDEAMKQIGMVVEGAHTIKAVYEVLEKFKLKMPITSALYNIIYDRQNVSNVIQDLMSIRPKYEEEGFTHGFSI